MKPETIQKILVLLKEDVQYKMDSLMRVVNSNNNTGLDERVEEYRKTKFALDDFEEWVEENEDD